MQSGGPESGGHGTPSIDLQGDPSARNVPIYVLFLIMLSSGIFTLIFLWICVQYIYHRRMIRQALVDLERMFVAERTWEAADDAERTEQEIAARHAASTAPAAANSDTKYCDDKNVELTAGGCMADYNWDTKSEVGGYVGQENKPSASTYNAHQGEFGGDDGQRLGERSLPDAPARLSDNGDVGGESSDEGAGAHDHRPSFVESQFGLEGTTGSNRTEGSDSHVDTSSRPASDGDGWRPEDLIHTQGSSKHEVVNKIKEKMPGHHNTESWTDPKGAPKKGVLEKIKEKLPGHHGNDAGM